MKYLLENYHFPYQQNYIELHGDDVWIELCDFVPEAKFKLPEIVERLPYLQKYKRLDTKVQRLRAVIQNVMLEDNPPIRKQGHYFIWT